MSYLFFCSYVFVFVLIGLNDRDRIRVQEDWMKGIFPVISATVSFGMGVDKGSVR